MATDENTRYWQRKANTLKSQYEISGRIAISNAVIALDELTRYLANNGLNSVDLVKGDRDRLQAHMDEMDRICGE